MSLELSTPNLQRWRGSLGAFALDPSNGWSMSALDGNSPTGPYILDETAHAQAVQDYFVSAGLPSDQIWNVGSFFESSGHGDSTGAVVAQMDSINSVLYRQYAGVRVADSYAWAKITTSGDVDMESVYWPPIDIGVANKAVAFASRMSDAPTHASYLAHLPGTVYRDGGVVIHHSGPGIHAAVTAYVAYDATLSSEPSAAMRHFDENGAEFRLPQELLH